jgi:hypothetical protein
MQHQELCRTISCSRRAELDQFAGAEGRFVWVIGPVPHYVDPGLKDGEIVEVAIRKFW